MKPTEDRTGIDGSGKGKGSGMSMVWSIIAVFLFLLVFPAVSETALAQQTATLTEERGITPGPPLTLSEALKAADSRNLSLSTVRASIEKADAQLIQAISLAAPMATSGLQYIRADHEDTVEFDDGLTQQLQPIMDQLGVVLPPTESKPVVIRELNDLKVSVTVAMPLINLKSWYSIAAARGGVELARMTLEDARQRLLEGVARAYYLALMGRALVDLQVSQVRSAAHHLDFARKRFQSGAGLKIDVVRAETDLTAARGELVNAYLSLDTSRDALGVLTGLGGLPMPNGIPILPKPSEEGEEGLVTMALTNRPDIRLSDARLRLSKRQFGVAWSAFLPTVDMVWAWSYQVTNLPTFGSLDKTRWNLMFNLKLPLFQLFSIGDVLAGKVDMRIAEIKAEQARIDAAKEVRQARRELEAAGSTQKIAEHRAELAKEALDLAMVAYEAGAGSSLDVTDARRTFAAAEVNLATARLKAQIALVALYRVMGKDILTVVR
ncbi:MAG: TolC family protein [Deltaproteobacteria bacterium]|nr:TolC family protein [Deltaproteobacteria bacterium]